MSMMIGLAAGIMAMVTALALSAACAIAVRELIKTMNETGER